MKFQFLFSRKNEKKKEKKTHSEMSAAIKIQQLKAKHFG